MPVFQDNFTGSAGALSGHTPDTGTWNTVDADLALDGAGGVVAAHYPGFAVARVSEDPSGPDVTGTMAVKVSGTADAFHKQVMFFRYDFGAVTGYEIRWEYDTIRIWRSGVEQTTRDCTAQMVHTTGTTNTLRVDVTNDGSDVLLTFRVNGTLITSYTDSFAGKITTAGKFGLGIQDGDGGVTPIESVSFDNATSALQAGTPNEPTATTTQVNLSSADAEGGSGSYTYAWHFGTLRGFTPSGGTRLTALGAHQTYADTTATSTGGWYLLEIFDGTDTVYSDPVFGKLWKAPLNVLYIGDSVPWGSDGAVQVSPTPVQNFATYYSQFDAPRKVAAANGCIPGTSTAHWVADNYLGTQIMTEALAAGAAIGATVAMVMLGTNPGTGQAAADFRADLISIGETLLSNGYTKVVFNYSIGTSPTAIGAGPTYDADILAKNAEIATIADENAAFRLGDTEARDLALQGTVVWAGDGVHLFSTGQQVLSRLHAGKLYRILNPGGALSITVVAST